MIAAVIMARFCGHQKRKEEYMDSDAFMFAVGRRISLPLAKVIVAVAVVVFLAAGCGGGGGVSTTAPLSEQQQAALTRSALIPDHTKTLRKAIDNSNVTEFFPVLGKWKLFDSTAGVNWVSAVSVGPDVSASMSNPFTSVGILVLPKAMITNPGQADFYIDGEMVTTLDLSLEKPYEGYKPDIVTYFEVANKLPDEMHTITMVVATGTVGFDGWRMVHKNAIYEIDCSDINELETSAYEQVLKLRDLIEAYADAYDDYPQPASGTTLMSMFAIATATTDMPFPVNPFTKTAMTQATDFSAGDFKYTYGSPTEYTLDIYGGRSVLASFTESSVETEMFSLVLTGIDNHYTTRDESVQMNGSVTIKKLPLYLAPRLSLASEQRSYTYDPPPTTFTYDLPLIEGVNDLKATLYIAGGPSVNLARTITRDTTAPVIVIGEPFPLSGTGTLQSATVYTSTQLVRVGTEIGASVWINDTPAAVSNTGLAERTLTLTPGDNTVTVRAEDKTGNTKSLTFIIKYVVPATP